MSISDTFPNCKEKMPAEEISGFMDTCKVDMCFDNGADAKKQMMDQFLGTCGDASAKSGEQIETDCARMAEIQKQLTGKEPVCPEGKIFDGCATECSYMTCEDAVKVNILLTFIRNKTKGICFSLNFSKAGLERLLHLKISLIKSYYIVSAIFSI